MIDNASCSAIAPVAIPRYGEVITSLVEEFRVVREFRVGGTPASARRVGRNSIGGGVVVVNCMFALGGGGVPLRCSRPGPVTHRLSRTARKTKVRQIAG